MNYVYSIMGKVTHVFYLIGTMYIVCVTASD